MKKSGERFETLLRFRFRRVANLSGIRVSDCVGTKNKNLAFSKVQTECFYDCFRCLLFRRLFFTTYWRATSACVRRPMVMRSTATDGRSVSKCQRKWSDQGTTHFLCCPVVRLPTLRAAAGFESGLFVPTRADDVSDCFPDLVFLVFANAGVVAKLNPATATISDDAIKAIVLVLKLLMFSFSWRIQVSERTPPV